jgi:hypothetical protein
MSIEQEIRYMNIINDDFNGMKAMLDHIQDKIAEYPVQKQLGFISPLKNIIFEALQDALNSKDKYLNGDSEPIKVEP